jgi:hypothetical protein
MNSMEAPLQIPYIGEEEEEIKEGGRRREREERGGGRGRSCPPQELDLGSLVGVAFTQHLG